MLYEVITTTSGVWIKEGNDFVSVGALFRDGSLRDLNLYRFDTTGHLKQIIRARITSYNVCYTKLLRSLATTSS